LIPTTQFPAVKPEDPKQDAAAKSRDYVRRHWTYREPVREAPAPLERVHTHTLCISGMAFQDAWNIDLQRLKRCCVHVLTPSGKLIPFCTYYLTGSDGRRFQPAN